jgi:hypothetical protein
MRGKLNLRTLGAQDLSLREKRLCFRALRAAIALLPPISQGHWRLGGRFLKPAPNAPCQRIGLSGHQGSMCISLHEVGVVRTFNACAGILIKMLNHWFG